MKKSITGHKYDKITISELSHQFHLNYYYIISAMYREAQNGLAELKRIDIGQSVEPYSEKCEELLKGVNYYIINRQELLCGDKKAEVHNSYLAGLKQALKELKNLEHEVNAITTHLYCNLAFHPLCSSLQRVIALTDALLRELIIFEKRLLNIQQTH